MGLSQDSQCQSPDKALPEVIWTLLFEVCCLEKLRNLLSSSFAPDLGLSCGSWLPMVLGQKTVLGQKMCECPGYLHLLVL